MTKGNERRSSAGENFKRRPEVEQIKSTCTEGKNVSRAYDHVVDKIRNLNMIGF
jgi:hypothetical protein